MTSYNYALIRRLSLLENFNKTVKKCTHINTLIYDILLAEKFCINVLYGSKQIIKIFRCFLNFNP